MTTITRKQLKSELSYWLHPHWLENSKNPEKDINEIVSVFCRWHEQQSIHIGVPIGDFALTALRENRAPQKYSTKDARFEILAFLVPMLDGIPLHDLNDRFSPDISTAILTADEHHNFKEHVWQQLRESEKDILRARVLTDQALTLATDPAFLEARGKFWELTAKALKTTHATALIEDTPQTNGVNVQDIVAQLFNADKEIFSTIYPTPNYGYYESMSTYIQLKIELLYWVKYRRDADSIAHDLCFCNTGEIIPPIGDYVYNCLTDPTRRYKTLNQHRGGRAKFETLAILIPKLEDTPLTDLHNRFSKDLFDAFLTDTERENLKTMVWQRLTENQKTLLRKRIQLPGGPNIATDPDFLDTARDPFWKLTATALRETYNDTLTKTDKDSKPKDQVAVSNFFRDTEKFATASATPLGEDGAYTREGYYTWILISIFEASQSENQKEKPSTQAEQDQPDPLYSQDREHLDQLINDEYGQVTRPAIDALVQLLTGDYEDYNKTGMTKLRNAWKKAPQLLFFLIVRILEEPALDTNLWTGEQHNAARIKDIDVLKKRALNRLEQRLQNLEDDVGDIIDVSIYELLYRGVTPKRHNNESDAKSTVQSWQNQIMSVIRDELLKDENIRTLPDLFTPEDQLNRITKTEIREQLKNTTNMTKAILELIKHVW